jgi:hypothetical protein
MYPNPQDALPLPLLPNLEQYKKQVKDLVEACRSGAAEAIRDWAANWLETLARLRQVTITADVRAEMNRQLDQIEPFARAQLTGSKDPGANCRLTAAQFVIARAHGFESWPRFARHVDGLVRAASPVSNFEAAAEAIVTGDTAALKRLLRDDPALIRARSTREHRATLLHYVAANGVEHYRQISPANAVTIAEILLEAGADVDAEAEVYGGGCTTLGLVATSVHPERAGVQNALMQILIDRGAVIDRPRGVGNDHAFVKGCLANGRGAAAEFLAARGACLDLEGAAGIGRLDVVAGFFDPDGSPETECRRRTDARRFSVGLSVWPHERRRVPARPRHAARRTAQARRTDRTTLGRGRRAPGHRQTVARTEMRDRRQRQNIRRDAARLGAARLVRAAARSRPRRLLRCRRPSGRRRSDGRARLAR